MQDWPSDLDVARRAGFEIAALTPAAGAIPLDEFARRSHPRLVLAVGSEGSGLNERLMRYADARVRIPMDQPADSLNVVVAAGIALCVLR